MIKLERPLEPPILKNNKTSWTAKLNQAIIDFGSYNKIPERDKENLVKHYRNKEIKDALIKSSNGKCAFCECIPSEGGYIEVEHFKPKSLYPDATFEWLNLLPACSQCNGSKLDHDTVNDPLLNPYDSDPIDIFNYDEISIKPNPGPNFTVAKQTIETCGLNSIRLWKPRADVLVSLTVFTKAIEDVLQEFQEAETERKKRNRFRRINEALQTIDSLMHPSSKFSAFCRSYLQKCDTYRKARNLVTAGYPIDSTDTQPV